MTLIQQLLLEQKIKDQIYIRGIKSSNGGYDSFKFILEKSVDFSDLDS